MKKFLILFVAFSLLIPSMVFAQNGCGNSLPFGTGGGAVMWAMPTGTPIAELDSLFYAYNSDPAGVWFDHGIAPWGVPGDYFFDFGGVGWFTGGNWNTALFVSGCPPLLDLDQHIQIVTWDADLGLLIMLLHIQS